MELWCFALCTLLSVAHGVFLTDTFTEQLHIRPFQDGSTNFAFNFKTESPARTRDFRLQPKQFIQIMHHYSVQELSLSMTGGRWNWGQWEPSIEPKPAGLELTVHFYHSENYKNEAERERLVEDQWRGLINSLAGLMCASINFLDTHTHDPTVQYAKGLVVSTPVTFRKVPDKYGRLPAEIVCTENLTPFVLLLPGRGKSGLGALLNPIPIFSAPYHSLSIQYSFDPHKRTETVHQTISVVFSEPVFDSNSPYKRLHPNWSIRRLLHLESEGAKSCPTSSKSWIELVVPSWAQGKGKELQIEPKPTEQTKSMYVYELSKTDPLNVKWIWASDVAVTPYTPDTFLGPLEVFRYQTGPRRMAGSLKTHIRSHRQLPQRVSMLEMIPVNLLPLFHTLSLTIDGALEPLQFSPAHQALLKGASAANTAQAFLVPPLREQAGASFELQFTLPANATATIEWEYEKVWTICGRYPPDAHRGTDLPGAALSVTGSDAKDVHVYAPPLLISAPTPDFSMPFNVITLSCTVIALLFGSVFNLVIREKLEREEDLDK